MTNAIHWTERSPEDFLYSIASDFVEQLQNKMEALDNMTRAKLAKAAGISKGRISQIFNDPGNISLDTVVRLARALGMKVAVTAYEDTADPKNERGPVNGDVFRLCWERAGRPFDMWDIQRLPQAAATSVATFTMPPPIWGNDSYRGWHSEVPANVRRKTAGITIPTGKGSLHRIRPADKRCEKEGPVS